jgi:hypothetical protein
MLRTLSTFLLLALTLGMAQAAPITGVTATSSAPTFPLYDPLPKTLDNTNLSGNTLSDVTTNALGWFSDNALPILTYNLNGSYTMSRFGFWNASSSNPPNTTTGVNQFGFQDVLIETSLDGVLYTALTGSSFATPGEYTFLMASESSGNPAEIVNFNPVTASFVRFTVNSTFNSSDYANYIAIMFDADSVAPELNANAANLPLTVLACLWLISASRRQRGQVI